MMGKLLFAALLNFVSVAGFAQPGVHTDMRTPTWNIIGLRYDAELSPGKWGSVFPPALKALHQKVVTLPGYMIPTKVGMRFSQFMFSIVPMASCPYCGTGDIPSMIEVKMTSPIVITEKPIRLRGTFLINATADDRSEFFLLNARLL